MDTFTLQDLLATGCAQDSPTVIKYINIKGQEELRTNVKNGNLDIVKLLINNNVSITDTVIRHAYENGNLEIIKILMDKGATVNKNDMLNLAVTKQFLPVVEYLLENDDITFDKFVLYNAVKSGQIEILKYLLNKKSFVQDDMNWVLSVAAENGHLEILKFLVSKGGDIKSERNYALTWSCNNNHIEVVKYLIENGSDVKANDNVALRFAAEEGHLEVVKCLIKNGADVNDNCILANTCNHKQLEVVKYLIENGSDVNKADGLSCAIGNNDLKIVKLLVQNGALVTDNHINHANNEIANYLRECKKSRYFGVESGSKLEIKLPELEEILHDNTYYYVFQCIRDKSGWTVANMSSKISILQSLNCGNTKFFSLT